MKQTILRFMHSCTKKSRCKKYRIEIYTVPSERLQIAKFLPHTCKICPCDVACGGLEEVASSGGRRHWHKIWTGKGEVMFQIILNQHGIATAQRITRVDHLGNIAHATKRNDLKFYLRLVATLLLTRHKHRH